MRKRKKDITYIPAFTLYIIAILLILITAIYTKNSALEYSFNLLLFISLLVFYYKKAIHFNKFIFISCILLVIGNSIVFTENIYLFSLGSIFISSSYFLRAKIISQILKRYFTKEALIYSLFFLIIFIVYFLLGFPIEDALIIKLSNIYFGLAIVTCGTVVLISFLKNMTSKNFLMLIGLLFIVLANLGISFLEVGVYKILTISLDQFFFVFGHYLFLCYFISYIPKEENKSVFL